ncbi:MAG: hypothetical protein QM713_02325 [Arachnia sp.]
MSSRADAPLRRHRAVARWGAALIFVTVLLGAMVCATDSSSSCPAWPACYPDRLAPGLQVGWLENPVIEFVHRAISFAALVLLGWAGWLGRAHADARVRVLPWVALVCAVGSAVFGMMIILFTLPWALGLLDLAFAIVALLLSTITAAALRPSARPGAAGARTPATAAFGALLVLHLMGSGIAGVTEDGTGSFTRCLSWPLWTVVDVDVDGAAGPQVARLAVAAVAALLVLWVAWTLWRGGERLLAGVLVAALVVEQALGLEIVTAGITAGQTNGIQATVAVAYSAVAVALLGAVCVAVARSLPGAAAR